ncbi:MAG: EamA family transporter [Hyphomicrobiaceae bacterium]
MELWIPITIFAAFMQNLRSALQKYLKGKLTTSGATFTRFAYGAPVAMLYLICLLTIGGYSLPEVTGSFVIFAMIGGLAQIVATALLVYLFSFRNFAVGTAFSKTETVQTAVFGLIVLGESVSPAATVAIMISLVGVIMLSVTKPSSGFWTIYSQLFEWSTLVGIASGAVFGISAISYRAATLSFVSGDFVIRAAFALACVTVFQTIVMAIYMRYREPGQIAAVVREWRVAALVGLCGVLGSAGWFTAMTLQNAAYVRALGQIELIFTFAITYLYFRERATVNEIIGIGLIACGILVLVLT